MRATSRPLQAQIDPSPAPSPWQSSPPTSTVSTIAFVAGEINTTDPLSSFAHTPCSSASNQSGPPSTSTSAIRPSVTAGSVESVTWAVGIVVGGVVVDGVGVDEVVATEATVVA